MHVGLGVAANPMLKRVGARTQPCFTPVVTGTESEVSPLSMPSWNWRTIFLGSRNCSIIYHSPSHLCCICKTYQLHYDTVNHRRLLCNVVEITGNLHTTELIRTMLETRRFFVIMSRCQRQGNVLPHNVISVLAPMLFNI